MLESKFYQKLAGMIRTEFPDIGERRADRIVEIVSEWMENIHDEITREEENRQSLARVPRLNLEVVAGGSGRNLLAPRSKQLNFSVC